MAWEECCHCGSMGVVNETVYSLFCCCFLRGGVKERGLVSLW